MSQLRKEQYWLMTGSLMILAVYAAGAILIYTRSVMIPFVLAIMFVSLISPSVDFQVSWLRFPHVLAVTLTVIGFVFMAILFGVILVNSMETVAAKAVEYSDNFNVMLERALELGERWGLKVDHNALLDDISARFTAQITTFVVPVLDLVSRTVLVLFFVIFLLLGRIPLVRRGGIYSEVDWQVRHYIGVKVALSLVTGILVWLALAAMKLELAGVFGLLAFLLNFIPVIGSVVATLLPIPMAVAQYQSFWAVAAVVAVPGLIQQIIGNGIEPKLLGKGLSLHPVTVVMALAVWGLLWGGAGMVLAVPITAILRIILLKFESVSSLGRLLGGELPKFGTAENVGLY